MDDLNDDLTTPRGQFDPEKSASNIPAMEPERIRAMFARRTLTISIRLETLTRYGLLLSGWLLVLGGYVLIGYAEARGQE